MWPRLTIDLSPTDVLHGLLCTVLPLPAVDERDVVAAWGRGDALIAWSVRSAWDAYLQALGPPQPSDEILMTSITIPDMVDIAKTHGWSIRPVPVDIDGRWQAREWQARITEQTRLILVTHVFGNRHDMGEVFAAIGHREILVVEDCAQSIACIGDPGDPRSHAAMHSFGPLKTGTTLGGAVIRVSGDDLRKRVSGVLSGHPRCSRWRYFKCWCKFSILRFLNQRRLFGILVHVATKFGIDADKVLRSMGRSYREPDAFNDPAGYPRQFRLHCPAPLYRILRRRFRDGVEVRLERRRRVGQLLDQCFSKPVRCGSELPSGYWMYPLAIADAEIHAANLRQQGFDATTRWRMHDYAESDDGGGNPSRLFLPVAPDMTTEEIERMTSLISKQMGSDFEY